MTIWFTLVPPLVVGSILATVGLYIAFSRRDDTGRGSPGPNQPRP